jgi:hypothetical protein
MHIYLLLNSYGDRTPDSSLAAQPRQFSLLLEAILKFSVRNETEPNSTKTVTCTEFTHIMSQAFNQNSDSLNNKQEPAFEIFFEKDRIYWRVEIGPRN